MRTAFRLVASLAAAPFLALACVGSDPDTSPPAPNNPTNDGSASTDHDGSNVGTDGGAEADACAGIDLSSNDKNCGRCGRSCGGTACTSGRCGVKTLATEENLVAIAAGNKASVYVRRTNDDYTGAILRVDKTSTSVAIPLLDFAGWAFHGSTLAVVGDDVHFAAYDKNGKNSVFKVASSTADAVVEFDTTCGTSAPAQPCTDLSTDGTAFAWRQYDALYVCKGTQCNTPTARVNDATLTSVVVSPMNVFYTAAASGVTRCERDACANPLSLAPSGVTASPDLVRVYAGVVYWVDNDTANADKARVYACAETGCNGQPKTLVKGESEIAGLAVDDSGVYFTYGGVEFAEPDGVLKVCRNLTDGCGAGSEVLSNKLARPDQIALDGDFVYFTTLGVTPQTTKIGHGVNRIAK